MRLREVLKITSWLYTNDQKFKTVVEWREKFTELLYSMVEAEVEEMEYIQGVEGDYLEECEESEEVKLNPDAIKHLNEAWEDWKLGLGDAIRKDIQRFKKEMGCDENSL